MKTSEILRLAKTRLRLSEKCHPDKSRCVCGAIWQATAKLTRQDAEKGRRVTQKISKALHPHSYISGWLIHKRKIDVSHIYEGNNLQVYRHRWLDHLIDVYEKAGD